MSDLTGGGSEQEKVKPDSKQEAAAHYHANPQPPPPNPPAKPSSQSVNLGGDSATKQTGYTDHHAKYGNRKWWKKHKNCLKRWWEGFFKLTEFLTFIAVIATTIYIARQWGEMVKSSKIAQGQLEEMKQARTLDERAWIFAYSPTEEISEDKKVGIFNITIKNTGRTPALRVSCITHWANVPKLIPEKEDAPVGSIGPIPPDRDTTIQSPQIPAENLIAISSGIPVYISGTIWYNDIFKTPHWTQFCFMVTQSPMNKTLLYLTPTTFNNSFDDIEADKTNQNSVHP